MVLKEEDYRKFLLFFGFSIIVLSLIELINIYILFNTSVNFYGKQLLFIDLVSNSNYFPLSSTLLFIFLLSSIFFFLIIGFSLLKISSKKISDNLLRAKYLLMLGVVILIFSFIKLGYLSFLERTEISVGGKIRTFRHIIFSTDFAPFYITVIWYFFTGVICYTLMSGLFISALGLNWILALQGPKKEQE